MTPSALRKLESVGFTSAQADALDDAIEARLHDGSDRVAMQSDLDTLRVAMKSDLDVLRAAMKSDLDALRAEMYRALWIQGTGIVAMVGVMLAVMKLA